MRGLTSLTEPDENDSVGAVVDVAVIGARGDGKTQFIVHAIRTLRAYAPPLEGVEHQYNRDVLQVVMSAREPRPEATPPGVVPHYVFRIRPDSLLSQVGLAGRLGLYARVSGLFTFLLVATLNAAMLASVLTALRGSTDMTVIAASGALGLIGWLIALALARRQFLRRGDIEIVFWDVAGEHVYSQSAADYYSFLGTLVRERRKRASASRSYAFAPVLICNPISLGVRVEGSPYARLRQLMPLFASLNEPLPRAMVAINRWTVVKEVCTPDANRDERVAVVPRSRDAGDDDHDDDHHDDAGNSEDESAAEASDDSASDDSRSSSEARRSPLPVVERDVVRKHCLDAEDGPGDGEDSDIHFSYLRYDAGIQCEFHRRAWKDWDSMPRAVKSRWRAPTRNTPDRVLDYIYEDGPGSFRGEVRRDFLGWLAGLAFHKASYRTGSRRRSAGMPDDLPDGLDSWSGKGKASRDNEAARQLAPAPEQKASRSASREARRKAAAKGKSPAKQLATEPQAVDWSSVDNRANPEDSQHDMWKPRPLSASGLEEFARGAILPVIDDHGPVGELPRLTEGSSARTGRDTELDARPATDRAADRDGDRRSDNGSSRRNGSNGGFIREDTQPGFGPAASRARSAPPAIAASGPAGHSPIDADDDADNADEVVDISELEVVPGASRNASTASAVDAEDPVHVDDVEEVVDVVGVVEDGDALELLDTRDVVEVADSNKRHSDTLPMPGGFGSSGT